MSGFIEGANRQQATLFPERIDDYVGEESPVRVIDVFIDKLDISGLGFKAEAAETGRPGYHPRTLLKIYVYGYLNQVHSSRQVRMLEAPDQQLSLTDPDARSMKSRGVGVVGYNVQTAVDTTHHLIVAHEVTNAPVDRQLLSRMARRAKAVLEVEELEVVADRGYYSGEELLACERDDIVPYVGKIDTAAKRAKGEFPRSAFRYIPDDDEYECPAGERLIYRFTRNESGKETHRYWSSACPSCPIRSWCTPSDYRRVSRWEHEAVIEAAEARIKAHPEMMQKRRATVEHPFGTLKGWMGSTHFLTKTLDRVSTEMGLHVLAYNMKRVINLLGVKTVLEAI